jgi:diaminopimelate epimerase
VSEPFVKLQGLGNDFVVLDRRETGAPVTPEQARIWCDRHRGIGADGILSILRGTTGDARMRVTNADGSLAEMCGNGLRCVAKFLGDRDARAKHLAIETDAGLLRCELVRHQGAVTAVICEMGAPQLLAEEVPMRASGRFVRGELSVAGEVLRGTAVGMGNPHLVLFETDLARAAELGPALERHPMFPNRTNVEFVRQDQAGLEVVVWERGCGLTQACGTGACAAVVAGILEGKFTGGEEVSVRLPGGILGVRVATDLSQVWMRGEAVESFRGVLP